MTFRFSELAVVVAGDALADLTPGRPHDGRPSYIFHPGGSSLNVATGLGRLGVPTGFLGRFSSDHFGTLLRRHLAESGVCASHVVTTEDLTTLAAVHLERGQATYSFHAAEAADRGLTETELTAIGPLPDSAALHVGSIALVLEPTASTLDSLLYRERRRRLISLDPNIRPDLIEDRADHLRRFARRAELADVIKLSEEDLNWLYPDHAPADAANDLLTHGAELIVLTRGERGARAWTAVIDVEVPAPVVSVVDTVGAGDAFTAAMLAYLHEHDALHRTAIAELSRYELAALLIRACHVAADTCTRPGADPPRQGDIVGRPQGDVVDPSQPRRLSAELPDLIERAVTLANRGPRQILGIVGAPGAGKSVLAAQLVAELGPRTAVLLPMDGFHLSNEELCRLGRRDRKGAPDTIDARGYADLLRRIRDGLAETVYAPDFDRDIDEPIAARIAIPPDIPLIVTEGNYLLLEGGAWGEVGELLDESWYLELTDDVRRHRLTERHQRHGMEAATAASWTQNTDEPNAVLVQATAARATIILSLSDGSRTSG